jgi:SAM-dependent methyltransferase
LLAKYAASEPAVFQSGWLTGKDVMDFGAGQFSPISVAVVLYVNGARSVVAFEPGGFLKGNWQDYVKTSTKELVADILMHPQTYALSPDARPEMIRRRLADIAFERLTGEDVMELGPIRLVKSFAFAENAASLDLILSTSVFEHVQSFEHEIRNHLAALRAGGVSINRVDFTDHRHKQPEFAPFGFYRDGVRFGCNLLRVSDLESAARSAGASYEIKDRRLAEESVVDRATLLERFAQYDMHSLRTMGATFILRR